MHLQFNVLLFTGEDGQLVFSEDKVRTPAELEQVTQGINNMRMVYKHRDRFESGSGINYVFRQSWFQKEISASS